MCNACKEEIIAPPTALVARSVIIHAGRLIDGVTAAARDKVSILIEDDRIVSVSPGFNSGDGAELIDLSRATVLPGFIDCHVHLAYDAGAGGSLALQFVTRSAFDELLTAAASGHKTLMAGFTSVRDVGGHTPVVVALRKSIAAGETRGPRMWVSGDIIGPTGGHSDFRNLYEPSLSKPDWLGGIADGADAAAKAVREHRRAGVNFIKIAASGGVTSPGSNPHAQLMTDAEMKAVVDAAHALDMKVAVHAHGRDAINHATEIGVDSIEHGTFADETSYAIMKARGTWLVPTLLVGLVQAELVRKHPDLLPASAVQKVLGMGPLMSRNLADAYRAGVRIAFGTDSGVVPHGQNAREFGLLVAAGMSPMEAITTATSAAAELIGASHDIGSVEAGRFADLVAVTGDPLADITELERVAFVMKGGEVIKSIF